MLSTLEPESAYSAFNLNLVFLSLHSYSQGGARQGIGAFWKQGGASASLTLVLESHLLSTLEPDSAYVAFNL